MQIVQAFGITLTFRNYLIDVSKEEKNTMKICLAKEKETEEILALYRTMLYGAADWNEYYPSEETIAFDLSRDALYVMKNESGEIVAAISIDQDEEVEQLDCWHKELKPVAEVSRLVVRKDMQNQGIAKKMMNHVFAILKAQGNKGVHILVKTGHEIAFASYEAIGFEKVGECRLFDKDFVCMEKEF